MKADCRKKKRDDEERKTEQFDFFTCCDESTKTDDRTNEPFWSQQLGERAYPTAGERTEATGDQTQCN